MSGTQCQRNINHDTDPDEIIRILTLWSPLENKFAIWVQILVLTGRKALRSHYHRETWFLSALLIPTLFTKEVAEEQPKSWGRAAAVLQKPAYRESARDTAPQTARHRTTNTAEIPDISRRRHKSFGSVYTTLVLRVCVFVCMCVCAWLQSQMVLAARASCTHRRCTDVPPERRSLPCMSSCQLSDPLPVIPCCKHTDKV